MMKPLIPVFGLLFAGGCTLTPLEVIRGDQRTEFTSSRPPDVVASCVARNADNFMSGTHANVLVWGDGYEVIVRHDVNTAAVVRVLPRGAGSAGVIYVSPVMHTWDLRERLPQGC